MTNDTLVERWRTGLATYGFDLVQAFAASDYNDSPLARELEFRLPTLGQQKPLALLVAHSRALWDVFPQHVRRTPELLESENPLDRYTESAIHALGAGSDVPFIGLFSHQVDPVVPIQRIAATAGLAELSPCHLSVHSELGPWLGLRAVLVFDRPYSSPTGGSVGVTSHCSHCKKPCLAVLEQTSRAAQHRPAAWRDWLAVRDSCPVGRSARYGEAQIRYHYTKERRWLIGSGPNTPEIE